MKVRKRLPVGVENFEQIVNDNYYYVDKTGLISVYWELLDNNMSRWNFWKLPEKDHSYPGYVCEKSKQGELLLWDTARNLDQACEQALQQIEEKKYDEELRENGVDKILKYGIACYRKRCKAKLARE